MSRTKLTGTLLAAIAIGSIIAIAGSLWYTTSSPVQAGTTPTQDTLASTRPASAKTSAVPIVGGHLNVGSNVGEFTNLNPATINQVRQFQLTRQIVSGLTLFDENLSPRPELAESWEVSGDGLTWTINIREDAAFSTGRDFMADDVIFTYDNTLDPDAQSIHTQGLGGVLRPVKIDDKTVQISTLAPRASFLTKVLEGSSGRVMNAIDREKIEADGQAGFNRHPVGAGWFRVIEHDFGNKLELEQNPFYWDIQNRRILETVTVFNFGDGEVMIAALQAGELDFVESYPVQFFDELSNAPGIVIDDTPDIGFQMIAFNRRGDRLDRIGKDVLPTDDVRVRRAIGNALNRQSIIDSAFAGRAIPAFSPIPPAQTNFFVDLSQTSLQRFNLPEAQRLMQEVFEERGEELGFNQDGGFEVKLLTTPPNRVPAEAIALALKDNINVDVILEVVPANVRNPRIARGEFEWQMPGSGGDPDPDDSIDDWFAAGSKFNTFGYNNERVNELNLIQKTATDLQTRRDALAELQEILTNDMPAVFTYHFISSNAYSDSINGYVHVPGLADFDKIFFDDGVPVPVPEPQNINGSLTIDNADTSYDPAPVDGAPGGVFTIVADFKNVSNPTSFSGVFFEVVILHGSGCPCAVLNADGGAGGVGSTVDVGDVAAGQSFAVTFEIGLTKRARFTFFVDAFGIP